MNAGDILVGKVTPKGETPMTPEEKLLRAIFGEKAADVRDTSLRVPPGVTGTIVEVRVFNRHGVDKDQRALAIERPKKNVSPKTATTNSRSWSATSLRGFRKSCSTRLPLRVRRAWLPTLRSRRPCWTRRRAISGGRSACATRRRWARSKRSSKQYDESKQRLDKRFADKVEKLRRGDELAPGVMKMVKVFVAVKRKLQPGDKMAGRHGNKGVISRILPIEDMPYLEDGTQVDVVLNPLGVPSRMNVGQILETHLGWACAGLGRQIGEVLDKVRRDGKFDRCAAR